jgi:FHA domain
VAHVTGPIAALLLEFTTEDGDTYTHAATRPCVVGKAEGTGLLNVPDGEFVGVADSYLSRAHCVFAPANGGWVVMDAGSMNGTWQILAGGALNRIRESVMVGEGMQLQVGHSIVRAVPA